MSELNQVEIPKIKLPFHNTSTPREHTPKFSSIEEEKNWMEDKLKSRLNGEYESMGRRLNEIVRHCCLKYTVC